jgi:monovalent cation/proton antiporter MnhG/PhaG subunit
MMLWIIGACLLGGAMLCLLAAVGVLRLPDVFMRMHAATKSGVVGCGLILVGVGLEDGSLATVVKVGVTIVFLLLTTPVAGHLLGRAAYVSGAPFWHGTATDQLQSVLRRRCFGPRATPNSTTMPSSNESTPVC